MQINLSAPYVISRRRANLLRLISESARHCPAFVKRSSSEKFTMSSPWSRHRRPPTTGRVVAGAGLEETGGRRPTHRSISNHVPVSLQYVLNSLLVSCTWTGSAPRRTNRNTHLAAIPANYLAVQLGDRSGRGLIDHARQMIRIPCISFH